MPLNVFVNVYKQNTSFVSTQVFVLRGTSLHRPSFVMRDNIVVTTNDTNYFDASELSINTRWFPVVHDKRCCHSSAKQ